jgi:transposase InsO family protein
VLQKFMKRAQNEFDAKVKKIRSDNITEFKNTQVEEYLDQEGSKHAFFAPYTPQQNGVAERKNRTTLSREGQCLMNTRPPTTFGSKRST